MSQWFANAMEQIMNFSNILNASIAASWMVLAVIALRLVLKKAPRWAHVALWGLVAVRLLLPFSIESPFSLIPSTETVPQAILVYEGDALQAPASLDIVSNPVFPESVTVDTGETVDRVQVSMVKLTPIWIAGMTALLLYTTVSYWRLKRKVSEAVILRDNIYQSENVGSPFVLGMIKPKIYLPYNMDEQDLSHVVAHEQAHIRRKDHWWKPLGFLLLTVHWFNPLMWLAYALLCRDIELACDEKVIKELGNEQRADYTQALVACSVGRRMIAACPLAFGEVGVKERVKSIMNYKKPTFLIMAFAVMACLIVAICFLTNPNKSPHNPIILPTAAEIDSIDITTLDGSQVSYSDREWIEQFLAVVTQAQATTRESIQDVPNVDIYGKVDIANNGGVTTFFYYVDEEKFCIEQPYEGIYETDVNIDSLVKGIESSQASYGEISAIDDLDNAISAAILDHYRKDDSDGLIHVESHVLLANETMSGTPQFGADNHMKKTTVYLLVFHEKYSTYGGTLEAVGGSYGPAALTFTISDSGEYILEEYWEPRDGGYYADDIRDKFPGTSADDALNDQAYIEDLEAQNYSKALAYMNSTGSLDTRIAELLDEICSSPGVYASGPDKYLEAHESEYQELLDYGEYTLRYCFTEFLNGGQTDLRGQLMALACQDIMLAWGEGYAIDQDPITGQDWFDHFRSNAESLAKQFSHEELEKNYPGSFLLLQLCNSVFMTKDALPVIDDPSATAANLSGKNIVLAHTADDIKAYSDSQLSRPEFVIPEGKAVVVLQTLTGESVAEITYAEHTVWVNSQDLILG